MVPGWDASTSALFLTGYLVELCLSMDNVLVIAVIFSYFGVPRPWQHRVLFWGILGALVLRGTMIWLGSELLERVHWALHVFGVFLIATGVKMLLVREDEKPPDLSKNPVVRLLRHCLPISDAFDHERFTIRSGGRWMLTPLAVVLVVVETTDVLFAVDSIPAIFGITREPFLVFTSNIFAILGLRSLYFVLASAMGYFHHLKTGLACVLVFIGAKMLAEEVLLRFLGDRLKYVSLAVVMGLLGVSILASILTARTESGDGKGPDA
jgi:tellurite resistance protein TerC